MKKSLLALAVLGSFASAASAANSVTLYGRVDVGYEKFSNESGNGLLENVNNSGFKQTGNNDTRLGIKGQEDLGNGLAATFQLEGRLNADTGSYDSGRGMFDRESTVGLKSNFGHVRFGRSKSAMERGLGDYNVGERVNTIWDNYSSSTRHSNAMFYDYETNGFNFGFDVSTKGGAQGNTIVGTNISGVATTYNTEGEKDTKISYGVHAGYKVGGFSLNAAYQRDSVNVVDLGVGSVENSKEWGVGASYNYKPVTVGASYAQLKLGSEKIRTINAFIAADITANDSVYAKYMQKRTSETAGVPTVRNSMYGVGYSHSLSKRTSVYADVGRYKFDGTLTTTGLSETTTGFNVAMRHAF
jgi:GBP family porin